MKSAIRPVLFALAIATGTLCFAGSNAADGNRATPASSLTTSLTTQERMYAAAWWPTKGDPASSEYAGEASCAKCHGDITLLQHTTPMYHAATPASNLTIHSLLKFSESSYSYLLQQTPLGVTYSASSGGNSDSRPVAWAFGNAETGQTYLLRQKDSYIESRLSYYSAPSTLDITVGHSAQPPSSLHDALGHDLTFDTTQRCFACHTTASTLSTVFVPEKSAPGVTCEACHGPGTAHIAAANAGQRPQTIAAIANPASMSPSDSVDFCGSCHRTFADVSVFMPTNLGAISVRFQPYRLEKSRCWGKAGDARITCVVCHDPHKPLVRESAAYDHNCLACHSQGFSPTVGQPTDQPNHKSDASRFAPACKVATSNCTSCHMPKVEVPQAHAAFTDHQIRIVRPALNNLRIVTPLY